MFGIGVTELLIVLFIGLPLIAIPVGILVFVLNVNKNKGTEQVPSYNELKVENERLVRENAELRE